MRLVTSGPRFRTVHPRRLGETAGIARAVQMRPSRGPTARVPGSGPNRRLRSGKGGCIRAGRRPTSAIPWIRN